MPDNTHFQELFGGDYAKKARHKRFVKHASLNNPDPETFYAPGEFGCTDYPFLS